MTGVTLIAVVRSGKTEINPGADYKFAADDTLVLLGEIEKIEDAIKILQTGAQTGGFNA